ncbi:MAG: hypothetical protein JSW39_19730 [Desulfobacterales bacterium]|nr:MAG: hypothetical protein JSW39_19730 [Desulfobacterales bacterium]
MMLATMSGFPDPYLTGREASYRRWSNTYSQQLIREDIRDLTNIQAIGELETLYYLLPSKVGRSISVPSLGRDLKNEPLLLIEAKRADPQPSPALLKFQKTLKVPAVQLINRSGGYRLLSNDDQSILIASSWQWLSMLP